MFSGKEFGIQRVPVVFMLCKKCGKQLTQDAKFCIHCGEPVTPDADSPKQAAKAPEKKKGRGKFWLIGAASFLFAAGLLVAVFFADIVAWAERLVLSPELLMKKAIVSAAQDVGIGAGNGAASGKPSQYTVGLYVDESIRAFLSLTEEGDGSWMEDLHLQLTSGKENDLQKTQLALGVKDQPIVSMDMIQDDKHIWVGIPELNEKYLAFSREDLGIADTLPSAGEMAESFQAYGAVLLDGIHRVTKQNATLKIAGIRQAVLQLTATIRPEDARQVLSRTAQQMEEDETLRGLLNQWGQEDIHGQLVDNLERLATEADWDLELITYLDRCNKLTGLELAGNGKTLFYWAKITANGKFASMLTCGKLALSGTGTYSDGKETGECKLTVDGATLLTYRLEEFALNKNGFSGAVLFPVAGQTAVLGAPVFLELRQKTVSGEETLSFNLVVEEKALVGLVITEEKEISFSVDVPEAAVSADEDSIEAWMQALDWSVLPERLQEAGFPINLLESLITE